MASSTDGREGEEYKTYFDGKTYASTLFETSKIRNSVKLHHLSSTHYTKYILQVSYLLDRRGVVAVIVW